MAAGLGFKTFVTGEVLTAADTNGYLMQGILVFASAAARDAAITSPQEGQACYLKDTNAVLTYSGSAWVAVGGGSSPLTTKGDLYTFTTVDARIGVGANNTVLTADSAQATGLKWAAPAATTISWTQVGTSSSTGASVTISSLGSYDQFMIVMNDISSASASAELLLRFNSDSGSNYFMTGAQLGFGSSSSNVFSSSARTSCSIGVMGISAGNVVQGVVYVTGSKSTGTKFAQVLGGGNGTNSGANLGVCRYAGSAAITSITYLFDTGNVDAGTVTVYGGNA